MKEADAIKWNLKPVCPQYLAAELRDASGQVLSKGKVALFADSTGLYAPNGFSKDSTLPLHATSLLLISEDRKMQIAQLKICPAGEHHYHFEIVNQPRNQRVH